MNNSESGVSLEVPVTSLDDALAAQRGGAFRVELNSALELGGLTPSVGVFLDVCETCTLPVVVMIRPRPGGFDYSEREFTSMRRDVDLFLERGATGFAFGFLNKSGKINPLRCETLIKQMGTATRVFHRAFDVTPNPIEAIEELIDLGIHRVMTSGQQEHAYNGIDLIRRLIDHAKGRIEILPAGGITIFNIRDIVQRTGCQQVHASLRTTYSDESVKGNSRIRFGKVQPRPESICDRTDENAVRTLLQIDLEG
jgi:copper homeostasis protein